MKKATSKNKPKKKDEKCCCGDVCKKFLGLAKEAKTKYDESDEESKKKVMIGFAGIIALLAGLFKIKKSKKKGSEE